MAVFRNKSLTNAIEVENGISAARSVVTSRGDGFCVAATTGTMAAALGANSSVFVMRLAPNSPVAAYIERIRIDFTTLTAFTTALTASRRLAVVRGSSATASSSGTSLAGNSAIVAKNGQAISYFANSNSGDIRIATTAALTVTGIVAESTSLAELSLAHIGASGGFRALMLGGQELADSPIQILPNQLLAIRNPVAMDAAGTWQMSITVDWYEAPFI
jgi:hypothetical protein